MGSLKSGGWDSPLLYPGDLFLWDRWRIPRRSCLPAAPDRVFSFFSLSLEVRKIRAFRKHRKYLSLSPPSPVFVFFFPRYFGMPPSVFPFFPFDYRGFFPIRGLIPGWKPPLPLFFFLLNFMKLAHGPPEQGWCVTGCPFFLSGQGPPFLTFFPFFFLSRARIPPSAGVVLPFLGFFPTDFSGFFCPNWPDVFPPLPEILGLSSARGILR